MGTFTDYQNKKDEERSASREQGGLRMDQVQGRFMLISGIAVRGESKFTDGKTGKPKPSLLVEATVDDDGQQVECLVWINGVLAEDLSDWFEMSPDDPAEGILDKVKIGDRGAEQWKLLTAEQYAAIHRSVRDLAPRRTNGQASLSRG